MDLSSLILSTQPTTKHIGGRLGILPSRVAKNCRGFWLALAVTSRFECATAFPWLVGIWRKGVATKFLRNLETVNRSQLQRLHPYQPFYRSWLKRWVRPGQWSEPMCGYGDDGTKSGSTLGRSLLGPLNGLYLIQITMICAFKRYTLQWVSPKHALARLVGYYNT